MFYNCDSAPSHIIPIYRGRRAWFSATTLALVEYNIDSDVVVGDCVFNLGQRIFPLRNWIEIDPHYNHHDIFWSFVDEPFIVCVNVVQTFTELQKEERFDKVLVETIKLKLLEFE